MRRVYELSWLFAYWLWCDNFWLDLHRALYLWLLNTCWTPVVARMILWKYVSILPLRYLSRSFLGMGSLGFSEFCYGARNHYHVVRGRARSFGKTFFASKIGFWSFLSFKKTLVYNFHWICSIMKIYIICSVPVQILYLGKIFSLRFRPKWSQPIRFQDI